MAQSFLGLLFVLHEYGEYAHDDGEEANALYQRGSNNHAGSNIARSFGLTGNAAQRALTNLANTDSCCHCCYCAAQGCTKLCNGHAARCGL